MLRVLEKRWRRGADVPAIENRPILFDDLQVAWRAFFELHPSRPSGFAPCGLRVSDVLAWLTINGYTETEDLQEIYQLILTLDTCWLSIAQEESKKKTKEAKDKKKNNGDRNKTD